MLIKFCHIYISKVFLFNKFYVIWELKDIYYINFISFIKKWN